MLFSYSAKDTNGQKVVGEVDAKSSDAALNLLKDKGLFVLSLQSKKMGLKGLLGDFFGVPETEVVIFTRQFSTMIGAGLSISKCLDVLVEQTDNLKMRKIVLDAQAAVSGGTPISSALSKYPKVFSSTYIALLAAAESSGQLDEVLLRLADMLEADRDVKGRIKSAMIYPAIVMTAMFLVFVLMMTVVMPKLADMYSSMGVDLPAMTVFMMKVSAFMIRYKFILIVVGGIGVYFMKSFLNTEYGRNFKSQLGFKLPVFGHVNKLKEYTLFSRTLSLLVKSGVPLVDSLNIVSGVVSNYIFKKAVVGSSKAVEKGATLSSSMFTQKAFPPIFPRMTLIGEETGQLDDILFKVSQFYANETDIAVRRLSTALEPIILIILGIGVGGLIISIITPLYSITQAI
jgi:type IV pilus assembly protein PilC